MIELACLLQRAPDVDLDVNDNPAEYTLSVEAFNPGQTWPGTFIDVSIIVRDVNNKPPVISPDRFLATVAEDRVFGSTVYEVSASDPDDSSDLRFSIQGDQACVQAFIMDGSLVKLAAVLDRETLDEYTCTIVVEDVAAFNGLQQDSRKSMFDRTTENIF